MYILVVSIHIAFITYKYTHYQDRMTEDKRFTIHMKLFVKSLWEAFIFTGYVH